MKRALLVCAAALSGCPAPAPSPGPEPQPPPRVSDRDGDGIDDSADRCPTEAEDRDRFEDADGCPDPVNTRDIAALDPFERLPPARWRRAGTRPRARLVRRGALFAVARGERAFVAGPAAIVDLANGGERRLSRPRLVPLVSRSFARYSGSPLWPAGGASSPSGRRFVAAEGDELRVVSWQSGRVEASVRLPDPGGVGRQRHIAARFVSDDEVAVFDRCRIALWRWREGGRLRERFARCDRELAILAVEEGGARWIVAATAGPATTVFAADIAHQKSEVVADFVGRPLGAGGGWVCWADRSTSRRETVCADLASGTEYRLGPAHASAVLSPGGHLALFGRGIGGDHELELVDFEARTIRPLGAAGGFGSSYRVFLDARRFAVGGRRVRVFDVGRGELATGPAAGARSSWEQIARVAGSPDRFLEAKGVGSRQDLYVISLSGSARR